MIFITQEKYERLTKALICILKMMKPRPLMMDKEIEEEANKYIESTIKILEETI